MGFADSSRFCRPVVGWRRSGQLDNGRYCRRFLGCCRRCLHQSRFSNVARVDWYFFIAALVSIPLWLITNTPHYSVLLVTLIDVLAFVPTFRKSWRRPNKSSVFTFALGSLKFLLGIATLPEQSIISSLTLGP